MSDEPWTITPEIQTGLSVNARGSLIPTDQLRELVRRVTKADAILASLPQARDTEQNRRKAEAALDMLWLAQPEGADWSRLFATIRAGLSAALPQARTVGDETVRRLIADVRDHEHEPYWKPILSDYESLHEIALQLCDAPDQAPIPMVLHCPACGLQHIDAPEADADIKIFTAGIDGQPVPWTNPPHRSHLCSACGHIWRPADVFTDGVAAITTRGKVDSPLPPPPGWRGIESAPRDGTPVLTYCAACATPKNSEVMAVNSFGVGAEGWWGRCANGIVMIAPTHWMPLPSPPSPSEEVG